MSKTKENGVVKLSSIQRSGEVQYESESFPITSSVSSQNIDVFLGYRRSLDFDQGDDPGQDFAAVWGGNGGYVVGVVADGVSQSFYGHLAAYRLSESLLNTLWENRANPPSKNELEGELKELEQKVATVVENYQIPEDLVQLHRESLEKTRPQGSQAVFAAFVLDVPNDRLHLYQVGDVDAIVHYPDKPPERIKAPKKGRWSSARKSELHLKVDSYKGASGIAIRSDGAGKDWGESLKDGALDRSAFNLLAKKRAGIDDLSFVAARWGEVLEGEVLEIGPPEAETQRVRRPVRPPHQEETEVLPGTRPYDSDRAPRVRLHQIRDDMIPSQPCLIHLHDGCRDEPIDRGPYRFSPRALWPRPL